MAPNNDVDPTIDFYEFLGVSASATDSEIKRAGRKTSLLYHPDKVEPTPENLEKFHLLQVALNILNDSAEKAKYDQSREARLRRKAEVEALDARRRKMREDLESREKGDAVPVVNGLKRSFNQRDMDIKRIAEENRRKMEEAAIQRKKHVETVTKMAEPVPESHGDSMDRSVKVRWIREGEGLDLDEESLMDIFPSGEVENVIMLKDKKRKVEGREKKVVMGTAVIVFVNIGAAKKIVAKGKTADFDSVEWAAEKEKAPS